MGLHCFCMEQLQLETQARAIHHRPAGRREESSASPNHDGLFNAFREDQSFFCFLLETFLMKLENAHSKKTLASLT